MAGTDLIERNLDTLLDCMDGLGGRRTELAMVCCVRLMEYAGYASVQEDAPVRPVWLFTVAELIARRVRETAGDREDLHPAEDEIAAISLLRMVQANDLSAPTTARAAAAAAGAELRPDPETEEAEFEAQDRQAGAIAAAMDAEEDGMASWNRSFPGPAPHDPSWVLDVVEDLRAFSRHIGEDALSAAFDTAHGQVRRILQV